MNKLGATPMKSIVAVAELAIPPDCDSGRCGFKSRQSPLVFTKDCSYDNNIWFCCSYFCAGSIVANALDFFDKKKYLGKEFIC